MTCPKCGIEPTGCLCVVDDTSCFEWDGDGGESSPYTLSPVINPGASNFLTCGADGLEAILPSSLTHSPSCQLTSSTTQSISSGVTAVIAFNQTVYDTDGMASLANNRIVIQTPGLYLIALSLEWNYPAGTPGRIVVGQIQLNGSTILGYTERVGAGHEFTLTVEHSLAQNDFIQALGTPVADNRIIQSNMTSPLLSAVRRGSAP